jgi:hypothetical protein
MSHTALRRVAIRLLHDPELARAVAVDPARALADVDLTPDEHAALAAVPPAAWRTDPERNARVLAALREEFVATAALAGERAAGFLRSAHFHDAIQHRGSLALAFGAYMAEDADPRTAAVARLETAIATVRRAPRRSVPSAPGALRRPSHTVVLDVPSDTLALLRRLRDGDDGPAIGAPTEHVLVLRGPTGDVSLEPLSDELAAVLAAAEREVPRARLVALASSLGAGPDEARQVVDDLIADGLLL